MFVNAIETDSLTKIFKSGVAVNKLNLIVKKGEIFSLLGQNGAGKTTTIKMLCCLTKPTSGDALLLGDSILTKPELVKQKINISPQETAVAPNLTVKENLEFIARIYGYSKNIAKEKAIYMMKNFNIEDRCNDKAKTLSGGMKRRLSIAMSLISDPDILFLDEPTLGLDIIARRSMWNLISKFKKDKTIILTTHYLEEAEELSDRISIMDEGKIKITGTVEEIKSFTQTNSLEDAYLSLTDSEEKA